MRLTFALGGSHNDMMNQIVPPNILISFEYKKALDTIEFDPEFLVLDSGAFSAWGAGRSTDIMAYSEWALEKTAKFQRVVCVNLDVIPGTRGRTSTPMERRAAAEQSVKNADYLRGQGLNIMEVFHQDESQEFLDLLLSRLPSKGILGISPRNDVAVKQKLIWQKTLMNYLYPKFGTNFPRTHGLAVTSYEMLCNFPYYSGDSSTWSAPFRFGGYTNRLGKTVRVADRYNVNQLLYATSRASVRRMAREGIENQMRMGDAITTMWAKRGIVWSD